MGYSSANFTEDVTSLASVGESDWHFARRVPETPCGQEAVLLTADRNCWPVRSARYNRGRKRESNVKGLEWNVREELVPGFCPKPVATGLGLRQVEPRVERSAGVKGSRSRLETRDAPDRSGGGGTG